MKANKFIIQNGRMRLGFVEYHSELLADKKNRTLIAGGGRYAIFENEKVILFYGTSNEFGSVSDDAFTRCLKPSVLNIYQILFSKKEYFSDAKIEAEAAVGALTFTKTN